jgi:hypothetical protein
MSNLAEPNNCVAPDNHVADVLTNLDNKFSGPSELTPNKLIEEGGSDNKDEDNFGDLDAPFSSAMLFRGPVIKNVTYNRWVVDKGYGSGIALAFQGDPEFIRTSVNFAVNYLLPPTAKIKENTPSFVICITSMAELRKAFELEGYCLKMRELLATTEDFPELDEDDFPDDLQERMWDYLVKSWKGEEATDPLENVFVESDEMVQLAEEAGRLYADKELQKIEYEGFMQHISRAGLREHKVRAAPEEMGQLSEYISD